MDREAVINDGSGYDEIYRMPHAQLPQVRHREYKKICSSRLLLPVAVNVVIPGSEAAGASFRCFYFHSNAAGNKQVEPAPSAERWSRFETVMAQDCCYFRHRTFVLFVFIHALTLAGLKANVKQFLRLDKTLTEVHTRERMNGLTEPAYGHGDHERVGQLFS